MGIDSIRIYYDSPLDLPFSSVCPFSSSLALVSFLLDRK